MRNVFFCILLSIFVDVFATEVDTSTQIKKTTDAFVSDIDQDIDGNATKSVPKATGKKFQSKFSFKKPLKMVAEQAPKFFIKPRAVIGKISQTYKQVYENSEDVEWQGNMPIVGVGITAGYKNFSLDIYAQQSQSAKDSFFEENPPSRGFILEEDNSAEFYRVDYSLNISYKTTNLFTNLDDNLLFSVGYKFGETNIDVVSRTNRFKEETGELLDAFNYPNNIKFTTQGVTVGIAYGFPIGRNIIGINLAYTPWLNADYSTLLPTDVEPDSTDGRRVGVTWIGPITNNLKYGLSIDWYGYDMKAVDNKDENSELSSIEESIVGFRASLNYDFNW
ncbi:hypothetical protein QUF74_03620 [Candidatus Halobeggiatoa sp. HSG11]|nr:hypothetical protein [Candidatus Halobeggiatoa sp. HSG11]